VDFGHAQANIMNKTSDRALDVVRDRTSPVERRKAPRHFLSAAAEILDMASGVRTAARVGDLSMTGCSIDTVNCFPPGTRVRVRMRRNDTEVNCLAVVRNVQPGMGMGLAFVNLNDWERATLENWIRASGPSQHDEFAPAASGAGQSEPLAQRLIEMLQQKDLLSEAEVAALLSGDIL
jgi:hypothetical protein